MKNPRNERLRRSIKAYHRTHHWLLNQEGLKQYHLYPASNELSWWDDVGMVINKKRLIVYWQHPRMAYADEIDARAMAATDPLPEPESFEQMMEDGYIRSKMVQDHLAAYHAARLRFSEEGLGSFTVAPSVKIKLTDWSMAMSLIAPLEVRNADEMATLVQAARLLYTNRATIGKLFPNSVYGLADWQADWARFEPEPVLNTKELRG